jgi:hypothetical protein
MFDVNHRPRTNIAHRTSASRSRHVLRRLLALALVCLPAILLYFAADISAAETSVRWYWNGKVVRLLMPTAAYYPLVDSIVALVLIAILTLSAMVRRLEVDRAGLAVAFVCLLIYTAAPFKAKSGAFLDVRFVAMTWLLVFACFAPRFEGVAGRMAIAATFGALALKLGSIGLAWTRAQPEIAQIRAALTCVPPLSRVVVATAKEASNDPKHRKLSFVNEPVYTHLGALALIDRGAFWPSMFTKKVQHPIVVRRPYNALARQIFALPMLTTLFEKGSASEPRLSSYAASFDFLLLLDASKQAASLPPTLQMECGRGYATLFRILQQNERPHPVRSLARPRR